MIDDVKFEDIGLQIVDVGYRVTVDGIDYEAGDGAAKDPMFTVKEDFVEDVPFMGGGYMRWCPSSSLQEEGVKEWERSCVGIEFTLRHRIDGNVKVDVD